MADRPAVTRGVNEADPFRTSSSHGARRVRRVGQGDLAAAGVDLDAAAVVSAERRVHRVDTGDLAAVGVDLDASAVVSTERRGCLGDPNALVAAVAGNGKATEELQMDYQKFVSIFYKTLNEKPSTIYKFYDKDAILVWTPHTKDLTSEIRTKKVIKWYMSDAESAPSTQFYPHCFVAQQQGELIVLVVNGNCKGFGLNRSNYVQSFLLTKKCIILSDFLFVFKHDTPIRVPRNQPRPVHLAADFMRGQSMRYFEQSSSFKDSKEIEQDNHLVDSRTGKFTVRKTVAVVYDDRMLLHRPDFYCKDGSVRMIQHNEPADVDDIPERISCIMDKLYEDNLMDRVTVVEPSFASVDDVLSVHCPDYAEFIECLPPSPANLDKYMFYNTPDMFCSEGTRDAVLLAAGAAIKAAQLVNSGEYQKAFAIVRPPGHHAGRDEAEGFCYFNNLVIAALNLLRKHEVKKILGVDWDVHHGNGSQELLYSSNEVLFFSCFNNALRYPKTMKQGVEHVGKGKGAGYNVNVPLRTNFGDADMLYVWEEILLPLLKEFDPDIILLSCGFDAALGDVGLAKVTAPCYATLLHKLIESGNGKVVLILEGGYNLQVLANCASHCVRLMTGDTEVLLKDDTIKAPPKSTKDTVNLLKHHLSRYWEVFKDC
nr:histone deacetylase 18-like isoform X2 [Lolium perenne]